MTEGAFDLYRPGESRLKVLYVVNHAGFFLSHRLPLAIAATKAGYEVHVAAPRSKHTLILQERLPNFHELTLHRSTRNPLSELRTLAALVQLYRTVRPDLVHHITSKPILYGSVAARMCRVRSVVNAVSGLGEMFIAEGASARIGRRIVLQGYRIAAGHPRVRFIFQNEDDVSIFVRSGHLSPEQTVTIAGSGVDLVEFSPGARRVNQRPTVVLHSRMLWTKGVAEFAYAARSLAPTGARFLLVGEPDPDNPASIPEGQLQAWHREGILEYLGRRNDIPAILRESDISCLPSYREGLPKSLIEAAATGLPIVTTDVPGCRDVVTPGKNGYLVPKQNPAALAERLRQLIGDRELRDQMGRSSRVLAESKFSIQAVVLRTLSLYHDLLVGPAVDFRASGENGADVE